MLHIHLAEEDSLKTMCGQRREAIDRLNGDGITNGEEVWEPFKRETSELEFDVCVMCQQAWDEVVSR